MEQDLKVFSGICHDPLISQILPKQVLLRVNNVRC